LEKKMAIPQNKWAEPANTNTNLKIVVVPWA